MDAIRWYSYCVQNDNYSSLLSEHDSQLFTDDIIVSLESLYKDFQCKTKTTRKFAHFINPNAFWEYYCQVPEEHRYFYEVILGNRKQKIHFDIDISNNDDIIGTDVVSNVCKGIKHICENRYGTRVSDTDILIYQSIDSSNKKQSFHIVLNNFYVKNHIECKMFYNFVLQYAESSYRQFVDHAVYSSLQNFRLLGSRKIKSNRVKVVFNSQEAAINLDLFVASLVSYVPDNCALLSRLSNGADDENNIIIKSNICKEIQADTKNVTRTNAADSDLDTYSKVPLTSTERIEAMKLCHEKCGVGYVIRDVVNRMIRLNRSRSAYCPICQRTHDNENVFLTITHDRYVLFWCRRQERSGRSLPIGRITVESIRNGAKDVSSKKSKVIDLKKLVDSLGVDF